MVYCISMYGNYELGGARLRLSQHSYILLVNAILILFADDQVIFSSSGEGQLMAAHKLEQATRKFKLKISTTKTKSIGFKGK